MEKMRKNTILSAVQVSLEPSHASQSESNQLVVLPDKASNAKKFDHQEDKLTKARKAMKELDDSASRESHQ